MDINQAIKKLRKTRGLLRSNGQMIVLFRIGDFYEAIDEDAVKLADVLKFPTHKRKLDDETIFQSAGVPYHSIDQTTDALNDLNVSVIFIEEPFK